MRTSRTSRTRASLSAVKLTPADLRFAAAWATEAFFSFFDGPAMLYALVGSRVVAKFASLSGAAPIYWALQLFFDKKKEAQTHLTVRLIQWTVRESRIAFCLRLRKGGALPIVQGIHYFTLVVHFYVQAVAQ